MVHSSAVIMRFIEERHRLHKAHQYDPGSVSKKAAYNNICDICKTVHKRLRDLQDAWLSNKVGEIQCFVDINDMNKFHERIQRRG